jgi:integrase
MVFRHARAPGWESARATPTIVREQLDALRRTVGRAPRERKDALSIEDLQSLVSTLGDDLVGVRNRAIILTTFLACNRRDETARLDVEDVEFTPEGCIVTLRRSKTDQEGQGIAKGVLAAEREPGLCPVVALRRWLTESGVSSGALFRAVRSGRVVNRRVSGRMVARIVKGAARAAGFDDARIARLSGHSLRAGYITAAARRGIDAIAISRQSGHRDLNSLASYVRLATLFDQSPSRGMV